MLHGKQLSISTYVELNLAFTRNRNSLEAFGILQEVQDVLREVIHGFFKKYDYFDDMAIDIYDFPLLLRDMGEKVDVNIIRDYIREHQHQHQHQTPPPSQHPEQYEQHKQPEPSSYRSSPQTSTPSPNQAFSSSISLSFEDCYYSLLTSIGSSDQDIMAIIRDILHTHSGSNTSSQPSYPFCSSYNHSIQSRNHYTTAKANTADNEDRGGNNHNQHYPPFYPTYASQCKHEQSRYSFNDMACGNDAEGYYDDENRFHAVPYQEEGERVLYDIPSDHTLNQLSHSGHSGYSQPQQSKKEGSKHSVLKYVLQVIFLLIGSLLLCAIVSLPLIDAIGEVSDRSTIPFFYLAMIGSSIPKVIQLFKNIPITDDLLTERRVTSVLQGLLCRTIYDGSLQLFILFTVTYIRGEQWSLASGFSSSVISILVIYFLFRRPVLWLKSIWLLILAIVIPILSFSILYYLMHSF